MNLKNPLNVKKIAVTLGVIYIAVTLLAIGHFIGTAHPLPYVRPALVSVFDPRPYWLKITNANTYPRYEITDVGYQDETQSGGNVNIYISVLDEFGRPSFGTRVRFNTTDGQNEAIQTVINGTTDFPQSGDSSFDPNREEAGPYFVEIAGAASDRISGMGLPLRRHVTYQIRFQKVVSSIITPIPSPITPVPGGLTEDDVRRIIDNVMREKFR